MGASGCFLPRTRGIPRKENPRLIGNDCSCEFLLVQAFPVGARVEFAAGNHGFSFFFGLPRKIPMRTRGVYLGSRGCTPRKPWAVPRVPRGDFSPVGSRKYHGIPRGKNIPREFPAYCPREAPFFATRKQGLLWVNSRRFRESR